MGTSVGSERQSLTNVSRNKAWRRGEGEGRGEVAQENILEGEAKEQKKHILFTAGFHRPSPANEQTINVTILPQHMWLSQCKMT